jgi:hypothetical protein
MTSPVYYITGLENAPLERCVGPSINPVPPTGYGFIQTPAGVVLQMWSDVPYGGWLCKSVVTLPVTPTSLTLLYTITIDDCTPLCGQVIETDSRITGPDGWTLPGDFQINIAQGWEIQYGSPWKKSGVEIAPYVPGVPQSVAIHYTLDWTLHTITLDGMETGGKIYPVGKEMPGSKMGWEPCEIVSQMQMCNNAKSGGYSLRFSGVGYRLQ